MIDVNKLEKLMKRLKELDDDLTSKRVRMADEILGIEQKYHPTMCRLVDAKKEIMKEIKGLKK